MFVLQKKVKRKKVFLFLTGVSLSHKSRWFGLLHCWQMLEALQRLLLSALNPTGTGTGTDRERDVECSLVSKIANIQMLGPFHLAFFFHVWTHILLFIGVIILILFNSVHWINGFYTFNAKFQSFWKVIFKKKITRLELFFCILIEYYFFIFFIEIIKYHFQLYNFKKSFQLLKKFVLFYYYLILNHKIIYIYKICLDW